MKALHVLVILLCFSTSQVAQRNCGSHDLFLQQIKQDPAFRAYQTASDQFVKRSNINGVITIPTVVHVIYNTAAENISDEQIYSQMQVLNEDFRRLNADADNLWPQAADTEFEFCLATRDPYGDPTCGITRTYSDTTKWAKGTNMKSTSTGGKTGWPADEYLNIWVCDIDGLLGFATFPGGDLAIDGVVTDTRAFGTIGDLKTYFNLGRTTTHEIGHWLNLRHIWGDGDCNYDDFVSDTPISDDHNYGCDIGHISCGSVDMVQNYMDYSDDICMNLFTNGQKMRMRNQFEPGGFRASLLSSMGCQPPLECNQVFIDITFDRYPQDISWQIREGSASGPQLASAGPYAVSLANQQITETVCLPDGVAYYFIISDAYGDGLCCTEGNGSYEVYSTYAGLFQSNGQFTNAETSVFSVNDIKYRFVGPGIDWMEPSNWNKLDPPSDCYDGDVIIEADCQYDGPIDTDRNFIVKSGAIFTIK
ncbi:zinc metalloprotease [Portibacter marinus]|uniref:zinc metalloprotease n=1 Tax=Portibacter marinus TaxID=2898660 RepID=UPI001F2B89F0|nr:zinc metalloprotease [Portibacter marinus]